MMFFRNWMLLGACVLCACGGRAIIDTDSTAQAGASSVGGADNNGAAGSIAFGIDPGGDELAHYNCLMEQSTFGASATLIDHEFDRTCAEDSDCGIEPVQTGCINACVATTASDISAYANALRTTSEQCLDCGLPPGSPPCIALKPACDRGRCVAAIAEHL